MFITNEMIEKARQAASAEELLAMAKEEGIALTAEEAEKYYEFLQGGDDLPEEALQAVAGGKGKPDPPPPPKYHEGQHLWEYFDTTMNYLHLIITQVAEYKAGMGYKYYFFLPDLKRPFTTFEWLETKKVFPYNPKP